MYKYHTKGDDDDSNNKHLENYSLPSGMISMFIFSASQNVK